MTESFNIGKSEASSQAGSCFAGEMSEVPDAIPVQPEKHFTIGAPACPAGDPSLGIGPQGSADHAGVDDAELEVFAQKVLVLDAINFTAERLHDVIDAIHVSDDSEHLRCRVEDNRALTFTES